MAFVEPKIILHNALAWTTECRNELSDYYNRERSDIILLNATGTRQTDITKISNYNVCERNDRNELHADIAIAVRKDVQHQILDDHQEVLAAKIMTTKGPVVVITHYSPPRVNHLPTGDIIRLLQKKKTCQCTLWQTLMLITTFLGMQDLIIRKKYQRNA